MFHSGVQFVTRRIRVLISIAEATLDLLIVGFWLFMSVPDLSLPRWPIFIPIALLAGL